MGQIKPLQWLIEMPKTDLHCHIGGSMRLSTILELADNYGIKLPAENEEELREHVVFKHRPDRSLDGYLEAIKICESVLAHPSALERAAYEICEDANKENVNIIELRFAPTNYTTNGHKLPDIVDAVLSGLGKASDELKDKNGNHMHTGLIIIGMRNDPEAAQKAAELAANYWNVGSVYGKAGVVGYDLAGPERGNRPAALRRWIMSAIENLVPITVHAGEDDDVSAIVEAFYALNASRIGHGKNILANPKVVNYADWERKGIEVCLTSNIDTGVVKGGYEVHPIKQFMGSKLRLSINTDNRTISDTNVTKEYMILLDSLGFSQKDIYQIGMHGIKSAFLPKKERTKYITEFIEYVKSTGVDMSF